LLPQSAPGAILSGGQFYHHGSEFLSNGVTGKLSRLNDQSFGSHPDAVDFCAVGKNPVKDAVA
jgi:hypothetical protein